MKLNNNGWGYREMIIYTCIILCILVFVALSISVFYDNLRDNINSNKLDTPVVEEKPNDESNSDIVIDRQYYITQEKVLRDATSNYVIKEVKYHNDEVFVVEMDTLIESGYMNKIYDQTGTYECTGYSKVYIGNENIGIVPYLSCTNFVTDGY